MKEISIIIIFLPLIVSTIFTNAYNITNWSLDNEILELREYESSDTEKETSKTQSDKIEILVENTLNLFISILLNASLHTNEINPHAVQCREILTPPPDFLA